MLVPSFLFGTAKDVRANVGRVITQLKRGATLEAICESSNRVDLADHPASLIWIEGARVLRPAAERDYRAVVFTNLLFDSQRIPFEQSNSIREASVDYLSASPWGTALLNSGHGWHDALPLRPFRPNRRAYAAILEGTLRHWEALNAIGARYFRGGLEQQTFAQTLPLYGVIVSKLGIDPKGEGTQWKDVRQLYDASLPQRIRSDNHYWDDLVRKWQSAAGTPELIEANLAEIRSLCEKASWDPTQWAFLRKHGGTEGVERAIEKVTEIGDPRRLLGVFIHALDDMDRAVDLYAKHEATEPGVRWADIRVAQHLKTTDPERAAGILFRAAERSVLPDAKHGYPRTLDILDQARLALVNADFGRLWTDSLERFAHTHRQRRSLIASLAARFS